MDDMNLNGIGLNEPVETVSTDRFSPYVAEKKKKNKHPEMVPNYRKNDKRPHVVFIATYVSMKEGNLFQPVTQIRCYSDYYLAKEQHLYHIQCVMDSIRDDEERQRFFDQYGDGGKNHIFYNDILDGSKYVLTLTRTKVQFPMVPNKKWRKKKED